MSADSCSQEIETLFTKFKFGTTEITPENEFKKILTTSLETKKPIRVKCGIDPTGFDVHIGHLIPYKKMRQFQDHGHTGVVIIGDYTASIGDPTGKNESRPPLSSEEIAENSKKYMQQLFTVLDESKTEIRYQSEWFKNANLKDVLSWAAQTTVAKLISHDTFKNRLDEGHSLGLHELFYPVLQGLDSLYIDADVELGGSDQRFNVLMGRDYQRQQNKRPQVAMLMPIILGTCGSQKMSKSLNNYIGVLDEPFDQFGKVMSIPDELMQEYFMYAANYTKDQYESIISQLKSGQLHPNEAKKQLASSVVEVFHGSEVGRQMREQFESVFKKNKAPDDIAEYKLNSSISLIDFLHQSKLLSSKAEAKRMIAQNAVSILDGDKLSDPMLIIDQSYNQKIIKVGKRKFIKILS